MKNTREYTINFAEETIVISKRFAKAANNFDSPEFKTMQKLRTLYAGFKFEYKSIKKNESKTTYKGLTISEMRRFISTRTKKEAALFEKVVEIADSKPSKYAVVKKWFMDNYKDAYDKEIAKNKLSDKEMSEIDKELAEELKAELASISANIEAKEVREAA